MSLQSYYDEHAAQARQHETQRERMTTIILGVAGLLVGLVTFSKLAIWSILAAGTVALLGFYGYLFAGKHYERFRFHTSIMKEIRDELDRLRLNPGSPPVPLSTLRNNGETNHYTNFKWPRVRGTRSAPQATAKSWIARQRLHPFWEAVHVLLVIIGLSLCVAIIVVNWVIPNDEKPTKIQIVK